MKVPADAAAREPCLHVFRHHLGRQVGDRVHEPTYGYGSVISVEDAFTQIQFDDNTVRKFLTSLAKIVASSGRAPTKRPRGRARKTMTKKTAGSTATKSTAKKTAKATKTAKTTKTARTTKRAADA